MQWIMLCGCVLLVLITVVSLVVRFIFSSKTSTPKSDMIPNRTRKADDAEARIVATSIGRPRSRQQACIGDTCPRSSDAICDTCVPSSTVEMGDPSCLDYWEDRAQTLVGSAEHEFGGRITRRQCEERTAKFDLTTQSGECSIAFTNLCVT